MARTPKPWFRAERNEWCVSINGKHHRLGPDEAAAKLKFHDLMANPEKPIEPETVASIVHLFLDWTKKHRAQDTYEWYQKYLQSFYDTLPKGMLVAKVKAHQVESWVDDHEDWGDSTRRGAMTAIARCFNWAERKGHIEVNPISRKLEKPAAGKRDRVISEKEYKAILPLVTDNFRDLITTCWETGCRPQEITRVEAKHVDVENGRWVFPVKQSKGKKHKRVVYLSDVAMKITKRLMAKFPEGPLFRNKLGNPWARFTVACVFDKIKEKLGVKYRLYDFRFSFCTNGLKNGVDLVTMQHLMGHTDLSMISRIYALINQDVDYMRQSAGKAAGRKKKKPASMRVSK